jgi:PST family polysaccharide transporter
VTRDRDALVDAEPDDLRGQSVRGGLAMAGVQAVHFALSLLSTAILARLLVPRDFGLLVMVAAVTNFLLVFRDMGLASATVQRAELTRAQLTTLFWMNAALGLLIAAAMAGAAPLVARFYGAPELEAITRALAVGFLAASVGVQHAAVLRRQMRFGSMALVEIASQALGLGTAVIAALLDAGYWALVLLQLVQQGASTAGVWMACRWRPSWPPTGGAGSLISFGAGLTTFNFLNYLTRNLDNVILGRVSGAAALGLYAKAYSLLLLPVDRVRGPISAVVIPALSRLQDDPARFRRGYLAAITNMVAIGMPAVVFLFVFAEEVILVLLGAQWQEAVLLFRLFAPAAFVETFNTIGSWACVPLGRTGRLVRWQAVATTVMVAAFLVGSRWGAVGMAIGFSVATIALRIPAVPLLLRGSPVQPGALVTALCRPACASLAAGTVVFALRSQAHADLSNASRLLMAAPVFASVYVGLLFILPGGRQHWRQLSELLRDVRWPRLPVFDRA